MNVIKKTLVRSFSGSILGWIEEGSNGDKVVTSFSGKILGFYDKSTNTTKAFPNTIVAFGDISSGFLLPSKYRS